MSEKRLSNHPEAINDGGLKNIWEAVFKQAVSDLDDGGVAANAGETQNIRTFRQLDAYHWLLTQRSDIAFNALGMFGGRTEGDEPDEAPGVREQIRKTLKLQGWILPQGRVTKISREIGSVRRDYSSD